jgi:hypothetical protein
VALPAPTRGASDNTNLIQQILVLVQSIQAILVGTDGSVASRQSDVTATGLSIRMTQRWCCHFAARFHVSACRVARGMFARSRTAEAGLGDGRRAKLGRFERRCQWRERHPMPWDPTRIGRLWRAESARSLSRPPLGGQFTLATELLW